MSQITHEYIYTGLKKVLLFTKQAEMIDAGIFDIDYLKDRSKYVPGLFDPELDLFDDSIYNGRDYLKVIFDHHWLECIGLKMGPSHPHERIFISTEPNISIHDITRETTTGNIVIFGNPLKPKGQTKNDNFGQLKLWEIEPFLDKADIEKLVNTFDAVSIFKKETVSAKVQAHKSNIEAFLQLSRAVSAESSNIMLATVVKVLLERLEIVTHKLIDIKISTNTLLQNSIDKVEVNLDLNLPWSDVQENDIKTLVENTRSDINFLTALKNQNPDPSDEVKEYAWSIVLEVCGMEFIKHKTGENQEPSKHINTLSGLTTNYVKNQVNDGNKQDYEEAMLRLINNIRNEYERDPDHNMQRVISKTNDMITNKEFYSAPKPQIGVGTPHEQYPLKPNQLNQ